MSIPHGILNLLFTRLFVTTSAHVTLFLCVLPFNVTSCILSLGLVCGALFPHTTLVILSFVSMLGVMYSLCVNCKSRLTFSSIISLFCYSVSFYVTKFPLAKSTICTLCVGWVQVSLKNNKAVQNFVIRASLWVSISTAFTSTE